jgi:cell division protein FtsI/penicillin-binding protein 2
VALGAVVLPLGLALVLVPAARRTLRAEDARGPIARLSRAAAETAASAPPPPTLTGLDTTKLEVLDDVVTAPLGDPKKVARLTVDPALQKTTDAILKMHHIPEAAVVLMDVQTGKVLVYASHLEKGPHRDLCVEATAPAASVFKVVTGSSLVENASLTPDHKECYSGGEQRLHDHDLVRDPKRDRWCTTLAGAMGRSVNTVFARLALEKLPPKKLEETARSLGFGAPLPFDVPVQASALAFPEDNLGYARTAAGFWNTTLSPLHAAWLSATIARGGEPVRPVLVAEIADDKKKVEWTAPIASGGLAQKRALEARTAAAVATMMESTVSDGTSYRAFHDGHGKSFLPGITVAGKTGTLTDGPQQRFYTWFTGFAPSRPYMAPEGTVKDGEKPPQVRQVAVAVLVVNEPTWNVKANVVAREVLRAYFASQKLPMVSAPSTRERSERGGRGGRGAQESTTPGTKQRRQRGS